MQLLPGFSIRFRVGHNRYKETEKFLISTKSLRTPHLVKWDISRSDLGSEQECQESFKLLFDLSFRNFFLKSDLSLNWIRHVWSSHNIFRNSMCPVGSRDIPNFSLLPSVGIAYKHRCRSEAMRSSSQNGTKSLDFRHFCKELWPVYVSPKRKSPPGTLQAPVP